MNWTNIFAVFIGSGLGGVCRYVVSKYVQSKVLYVTDFPWGTFAVNIIGCFLIGLFYGIFNRYAWHGMLSPQVRLLLTVGFCGGFTTFSSFINENYILFQSTNIPILLGYMVASIIIGFILFYAGYAASQILE